MIYKPQTLTLTPSSREIEGAQAASASPFRIYVLGTNDSEQSVDIRVSKYSTVFTDMDFLTTLPIVGLDVKFNIKYGNKVWLEVVYDKNRTPIFGIIRTGNKWMAQVLNTADENERLSIYPGQLEFISKLDLNTKLSELDEISNLIADAQNKALTELLFRVDVGRLSQEEYQANVSDTNETYTNIKTLLVDYRNDFSTFFEGAPTSIWKKLFRSYTLISYTTKDTNINLAGALVTFQLPVDTQTPEIPQATTNDEFKIIQCLDNDLVIADICFQNRFPGKLPMIAPRGISNFLIHEKSEEDINI